MARYGDVSQILSGLPDETLRAELAAATALGTGIGGTAGLLRVAGAQVFVKRVAVTDIERRPNNVERTNNPFALPNHCHYGVGAPSTSAWRELAMHTLATEWVLEGRCDAFPLMYHSRLLPMAAPGPLDCAEHGDLDTWVAFWHGSPAVRDRLEALAGATAELILFLEYVPQDLFLWLDDTLKRGLAILDAALPRVESQLVDVAAFMAAQGVCHFDAHFGNVLADDSRLYASDFGLAVSSAFELTPGEASFLKEHLNHDLAYVKAELVNWIVTRLTHASRAWKHPRDRNAFVRRCVEGELPPELPPSAADIVRRNAAVAAVMNDFYFELHGTSRRTVYPATSVEEALVAADIS